MNAKILTIDTKKLAENLKKKLRKPMKKTQLHQELSIMKFKRNGKRARSQKKSSEKTPKLEMKKYGRFFKQFSQKEPHA